MRWHLFHYKVTTRWHNCKLFMKIVDAFFKKNDIQQINNIDSDKLFAEDDFFKTIDLNSDTNKQAIFDKLLTYRRRMARIGAVQTLYLYDFRKKNKFKSESKDIFGSNQDTDPVEIYQEIISFYRNVFFTKQEYGWTKKNKKIDETFMLKLVNKTINSIQEIDSFIQSRLNGNWTTEKLDYVLRAIIRCAIGEILLGENIEKAVLCSEYTNLAGNFFNPKEIGFVNSIIDKLYVIGTKIHPFISNENKSDNKDKSNKD